MSKQKQITEKDIDKGAWMIFAILIAIALLLASFRLGQAQVRATEITAPRQSGIYVPIDGDNFAVIVLNASDSYERKLVDANRQAFQEITKLKQGGTK